MTLEAGGSWALLGEGIVAVVRRRSVRRMPLPKGLHRMPGPVLVVGERFVDSPVGPFLSLRVGEPARMGLRLGWYFGTSVVNNADARKLGRQYWGFPHELGTLRWNSEANTRSLTWEERGIQLEAEVAGRGLPILCSVRTLQHRTDGPVVIPSRLRALARRSTVALSFGPDDPLAGLGGSHFGFTLSGLLIRRHSARVGFGLFSTLRAPLRGPDPGVVGMTGGALTARDARSDQLLTGGALTARDARSDQLQWTSPRAYSSVG